MSHILVCGVGNPGRGDDGLGGELVSRLEKDEPEWAARGLTVTRETRYQLNVEDAWDFSHYDTVIIVDASRSGRAPFTWTRLKPQDRASFSTHALSPEAVLGWCLKLYGRCPEAFLLAVRGVSWEFGRELSPKARSHLEKALEKVRRFLKSLSAGSPPASSNPKNKP